MEEEDLLLRRICGAPSSRISIFVHTPEFFVGTFFLSTIRLFTQTREKINVEPRCITVRPPRTLAS